MALERAYQDTGFAPSSVGLIEAHGTGTVAGDPPEFAALNEVFSNSKRAAYCSRECSNLRSGTPKLPQGQRV